MAIEEMFASSFHLSRSGSAVAVMLGSWGFFGEVLPSAQADVSGWGSQGGTGMQKERSRDEGLRLLHGLATNLATSLQTPQEA